MPSSRNELIPIADLHPDTRVVVRPVDDDVVKKYTDTMRGDWGAADHWPYPPILVYRIADERGDVWPIVVDGWHRIRAAGRMGWRAVPCDVVDGTIEQAMIAAAAANGKHGHPLTRDERKRAVSLALQGDASQSDRAIARLVGCSPMTVGPIREALEDVGAIAQQRERVGADGKVYPTMSRDEHKEKTLHEWENRTVGRAATSKKIDTRPELAADEFEDEPTTEDDHEDESEDTAPEVSKLDTWTEPRSRDVGVQYATEAIDCLRRIPKNDGLRDRAYEMVMDYIATSR